MKSDAEPHPGTRPRVLTLLRIPAILTTMTEVVDADKKGPGDHDSLLARICLT